MQVLASSSSGAQAEGYRAYAAFYRDLAGLSREWRASVADLAFHNIPDYRCLKRDSDYERQRQIVTDYVANAVGLRARFLEAPESLKQRLQSTGVDEDTLERSLEDWRVNSAMFDRSLIPTFDAHRIYGERLKEQLDFLEEADLRWSLREDCPQFDTDEDAARFDRIVAKIDKARRELGDLEIQLISIP